MVPRASGLDLDGIIGPAFGPRDAEKSSETLHSEHRNLLLCRRRQIPASASVEKDEGNECSFKLHFAWKAGNVSALPQFAKRRRCCRDKRWVHRQNINL